MTRFQIRTPRNMTFETVLREMAEEAWKATLDLMKPESISGLDCSYHMKQVRSSISPYLKKYNLCNLFPECSDEVEGAPWLDRTDGIYLLVLPNGLNSFLDDLAFEALRNSRHLFRTHTGRESFARIRKVFRHALCRYLYFNPICGESPICVESHEVSPWTGEELHTVA